MARVGVPLHPEASSVDGAQGSTSITPQRFLGLGMLQYVDGTFVLLFQIAIKDPYLLLEISQPSRIMKTFFSGFLCCVHNVWPAF